MTPFDAQTVRGFIAESDTGTGRGGLRVELWRADGRGDLVAAAENDAAGAFHVELPVRATDGGAGLSHSEFEVRVYDADELLLSEVRELGGDPHNRLDILLPPQDGPADAPEPGIAEDDRVAHHVSGRVKGTVAAGSTVRVVLTSLEQRGLVEQVVSETIVDEIGRYEASYQPPAGVPRDTSLSVRLYSPAGELVTSSPPVLAPPPQAAVNLRPPADSSIEPSEYAQLEGRVAGTLVAGVESLDAAESEAVDEVAEWLDVDAGRLALLQRSRALARETGVPGEAFYALGRSGMEVTLASLLDTPLHELQTTLDEAAADRIVDARSLGSIAAVVEQLAAAVVEHAVREPDGCELASVMSAADIPPESIATVLRQYQNRDVGGWPPWAGSGEAEAPAESSSEAIDPDVVVALRLGELVGADPALLRRLHDRRRDGQWQALEDLAGLSFDDWCELVEDAAESESAPEDAEREGDPEAEAEHAEAVEARAEAILDTLEEAFPSPFIRRRLEASEDIGAPARQVMARATGHDFHRRSIRDRVAAEPELVEGLSEADAEEALADIEAVERVSRVADHAEDVALLVGTGLRSAMEIAALPRGHFIDEYAEALGGRAQASRVHAQAQQAASGAKLASVRLLQAAQHAPFVMGAKTVPDARTLFQAATGFCECEHCGSVYSPAAYFVDLLRYLNVSAPDRRAQIAKRLAPTGVPAPGAAAALPQPLEVLLARRPDLAHLPLTCENTLTALPYIDLVNELLEAAITGGSAAFDTGKTPADVLRAVPQNLSAAAYRQLQESVHPLALPYHQPLALVRAYLGHLGVTRLELIRALGRGDGRRDAMTWEALRMSPEEFAMVAAPPTELWKHLGFASEQVDGASFVTLLARVPLLREATGLTFARLVDVVSTRFLNGDDRLHLESPAPDCNPDTIRLTGLDADRLSRLVRLVRLQQRLGWTFPVLDRALVAVGATDLDAGVLAKLAAIKDVAARLDRPVEELLVLWASIEAWGANSHFDRLFTTRAVAWRTEDTQTFQLRPDRLELATVGPSLEPIASALLAAFRITSDELSLIRALYARRGTELRLDLAGLSAVHRVVVLSRALQLRIPALDLLLRLVPADADPFRPGEPAATVRFIEIVREVQATDFTPERLAYLFRHEWEPRRDPGPLATQVQGVLAGIRQGLTDAFAETTHPSQVTTDTLRQKLALVLDPTLLDPALSALDPSSPIDAARRRQFFDRHLARIFADPAAAAARLLEPPPAEMPREALEQRWKMHIHFVLEHLLPRLRSQQLRGAVVQTLSDTLGMSVPATARLLVEVMRSRRTASEPLLADFLAMLGTGLTGEYFETPDLQGAVTVTRIDPELTFAWAGAPPADGIPGREFSVRWTGHLLVRAKAAHTFYLQSDGAVRLVLVINGKEQTLIDQPEPASKPVEHVSEPVLLDPAKFAGIRLEYRNKGTPAVLTLQMGTGPVAKLAVPTPQLYPVNGLSSFAPVEEGYRRLHKAAMIVSGFAMTDAQLAWLTRAPAFVNLDALPMAAADDAPPLFQRWRQLASLYAVRKTLPRSNTDLFDVFLAPTLPEALDRLVLATGWNRAVVEALVAADGRPADAALRPPADPNEEPLVARLARAVEVQRRAAVAPATLQVWANTAPDADAAASVVQAVKSRYDEARWLEVAQLLNDPLRAERRDALVAFLLPGLRARGVTNRNQLFEHFLIDVDMNPCMLTSRIRQATGAVQTFFQRCLMNLESQVPPRVIADSDWKWLKNYRVWEANRKVFLYPENWIEPELRDDKSPLFQALESSILQQEIKNENVEAAFSDYLEGLDEIARLDIRGVWFEARDPRRMVKRALPGALGGVPPAPHSPWADGTYHVFARTFNAPHLWYYRRLERGRNWTAWEKIEADIEGEHLVPVIFNRRMHLFWTLFREVSKPLPPMDRESKGAPPSVGKDWEIQLAYTVYDRGRWSRKRVSTTGVVDYQTFVTVRTHDDDNSGGPKLRVVLDGSRVLSPTDYTLRAAIGSGALPQLRLHLYSRSVDRARLERLQLVPAEVERVATFGLNGCNGELVPDRVTAIKRAKISKHTHTKKTLFSAHVRATLGNVGNNTGRAGQPFGLANGGAMSAPAGYYVSGMGMARSRKAGGALLALPTADRRGTAVALPQARSPKGTRIVPVTNPARPDERGLQPFFFQDQFRSYFVRPVYANWRPPALVAAPLFRRPALRLGRPGKRKPGPVRRGGRGRREAFDEGFDENLPVLDLEAQDMWEAEQDEAWHPDDAAEARKTRRRKQPARPRPAA
ncbi:MAG: neuraminidase-like domain-containing protein, partial [Acidobacteriota bacterium]|nr:neuraminidase-like domain-containing protein [Acidobacteriota bacterium]